LSFSKTVGLTYRGGLLRCCGLLLRCRRLQLWFRFPGFRTVHDTFFGFDAVFVGAAAVFFVDVDVDFVGILNAVAATLAVALAERVDVAVNERRRQAIGDVEEHLPL